MRKVYSACNEVDAHLARALLAEAGIEASVQAAALSNVLGAIPVNESTLPSLWVRDEDFEQAMKQMERFGHPPEHHGPPWKCPGCGKTVERQFTDCWNCGAARPT